MPPACCWKPCHFWQILSPVWLCSHSLKSGAHSFNPTLSLIFPVTVGAYLSHWRTFPPWDQGITFKVLFQLRLSYLKQAFVCSTKQGLGSQFSTQTGVCGKVASPFALQWQPYPKSMVRACRVCHMDLRLPYVSTTWLNFHRRVTGWILADETPCSPRDAKSVLFPLLST